VPSQPTSGHAMTVVISVYMIYHHGLDKKCQQLKTTIKENTMLKERTILNKKFWEEGIPYFPF
jgi:hypothetical protein